MKNPISQVKSQSQGRESTPRKVSAKTATKGTPRYGLCTILFIYSYYMPLYTLYYLNKLGKY